MWYPDGACRFCGASAYAWSRVSGRGTLFSWSVVRRAFIPQLADRVPYVTGLVAFDEDPAVRMEACDESRRVEEDAHRRRLATLSSRF